MTKKSIDKTAKKRDQWVARTAAALNISEETARALLRIRRQQGVRLNPLQNPPANTIAALQELGWKGSPVNWCANGLTLDTGYEAIRDSELVSSGAVYIQNAASWLPVLVLDPQPEEAVLDVCAAPGGKTAHIAAITNNQAHITANDNSRTRLKKLQTNLDRLGVANVDFTLYDASKLTHKRSGYYYDKILLDAPCSGEGMMTLENNKDFESWSVAHIKRLQQLQKRIITQAWQLLKPGGTLVYSTCTMAPEENEAVIDYLLKRNGDAFVQQITLPVENRVPAVKAWNDKTFNEQVQFSMRLVPSPNVEAFFVCKIKKIASLRDINFEVLSENYHY